MIEYKNGNLYMDGDRIVSLFGQTIANIQRTKGANSFQWTYHFSLINGEELSFVEHRLSRELSRLKGHSHVVEWGSQYDAMNPSGSSYLGDINKYEGQLVIEEANVPLKFKTVWMPCEYCKTRNKVDEGYNCVACGAPLPCEIEPEGMLVFDEQLDNNISTSDLRKIVELSMNKNALHAKAAAEANWGTINKPTNWKMR